MQPGADPIEQPPRLAAVEHGQQRQRLEQPHPIPRRAAAPPLCFSIFESRPAPISDARQASADQLKSLLLTYRLRHRENCVSVLWQEAAGYVLRGTLQDCCLGGGGGDGDGSSRRSSSTTNSDNNNNDADRKSVNNSESHNDHDTYDIDTMKDDGDNQHSGTGATTAIGHDDGGGSGSGTYIRLGLTPVMELAQLYHAFRFIAIGAPRGGPDDDNNGLAGGSSGFRFEAATAATVPEMAPASDEASLLQVFKQEANVFGSCSASSTAMSPGIETPMASSSGSRDPRSPYH
ncbi:hypothetical protein MN608_10806 [Microdochium nivale]|nr:hypothetical protein MN608_10806 [Microdochium nivale]